MFGHVTKRLSAYCNGELPPAEVQQVEAHLAGCERCRSELEEIRLGVALASHLGQVPAPDSLWNRVEAALDKGAAPELEEMEEPAWQDWRAWGAVAAVVMVALWLAVQWLPRESDRPQVSSGQAAPAPVQPAVFDLGPYLRPVQAANARGSYQQIWNAPPDFAERKRDEKFRNEWLNRLVSGPAPLDGYELNMVRSAPRAGAPILQLVYTKAGADAFSVFVAPKDVEFQYGKENAYEAEVGGVWCRRVDCPLQKTFEFGAGGVKCVLVSKTMDDRSAAKVMSFFLAAYRNISSNLPVMIQPASHRLPQAKQQPPTEEWEKARLLKVGKKTFVAKCGSCHDEDGSKPLASGAPLNQRNLTDEVIAQNVTPRLRQATDEEKRAVAAYIRSFRKPSVRPDAQPASP